MVELIQRNFAEDGELAGLLRDLSLDDGEGEECIRGVKLTYEQFYPPSWVGDPELERRHKQNGARAGAWFDGHPDQVCSVVHKCTSLVACFTMLSSMIGPVLPAQHAHPILAIVSRPGGSGSSGEHPTDICSGATQVHSCHYDPAMFCTGSTRSGISGAR